MQTLNVKITLLNIFCNLLIYNVDSGGVFGVSVVNVISLLFLPDSHNFTIAIQRKSIISFSRKLKNYEGE